MAASGCGKFTLGEVFAKYTRAAFFDGDNYHPEENTTKVQSDTHLNDDDR